MTNELMTKVSIYFSIGWTLGILAYFIGFKIGEYRERNRNTNNN